jgi:hypothetical protein
MRAVSSWTVGPLMLTLPLWSEIHLLSCFFDRGHQRPGLRGRVRLGVIPAQVRNACFSWRAVLNLMCVCSLAKIRDVVVVAALLQVCHGRDSRCSRAHLCVF